ncbi:MAG: MarR family transcriptional regulator [Lachnospiraceae bacterium]|nr:MarR family transcriptional regulator [Lachnospiraceae bacterium]
MEDRYESLKLCRQLCFPVYACSKEITRAYKPILDRYDLTYTQYITLMVLWEQGKSNVKKLGDALLLDSGTLTPVLKKLEAKGYITRNRSEHDERNLEVEITPAGETLREEMLVVPEQMGHCMNLQQEEIDTLYALLYKLLGNVRQAQ